MVILQLFFSTDDSKLRCISHFLLMGCTFVNIYHFDSILMWLLQFTPTSISKKKVVHIYIYIYIQIYIYINKYIYIYIYIYINYSGEKTTPLSKKYFDMMSSTVLLYIYKLYIYIYTNLPVNVIVRLPHPRSGDSQVQEMLLVHSADKQTRNYDIECSNHPIPLYQPKGEKHWDIKGKMVSHIYKYIHIYIYNLKDKYSNLKDKNLKVS